MQTIQPPFISHRLRDSDSKQPLNILTHHYRDDVLPFYFKDVKNGRGVSKEMLQVLMRRVQLFLNACTLSPVDGGDNPSIDSAPTDGGRVNLEEHERAVLFYVPKLPAEVRRGLRRCHGFHQISDIIGWPQLP